MICEGRFLFYLFMPSLNKIQFCTIQTGSKVWMSLSRITDVLKRVKSYPSKLHSKVSESTPQILFTFSLFIPDVQRVWSRLLFLGRFSSQPNMKTLGFLLRNVPEAPSRWFTTNRYKSRDSELLPIRSQECLLHQEKYSYAVFRPFLPYSVFEVRRL